MQTSELEFSDYLKIIWRRKTFIVFGTLLSVIMAAAITMFMPRLYRGTAVLMVEESKIPPEGSSAPGSSDSYETYAMTYKGIIKNRVSMKEAISNFSLDKEPYNLTLEDLEKKVNIEPVKKSRLLLVSIEFPDRNLSMEIANFLAEKAIELNDKLSEKGSGENKDFIKTLMDSSKITLDAAENELLSFREISGLELSRKKRDMLLNRKGEIDGDLLRLEVTIKENEARIVKDAGKNASKNFITIEMLKAKDIFGRHEKELLKFRENAQLPVIRKKMEAILSRRGEIETGIYSTAISIAENETNLKTISDEFNKKDKTVKLSRILAEDPLYQYSVGAASKEDLKNLFNLTMEVEEPDATYGHLEKKRVDTISALSGLYTRKDYLKSELEENLKEFNEMQTTLSRKDMEIERLERDYIIAKENYLALLKDNAALPVLSGLYAKKSALQNEFKNDVSELNVLLPEVAHKEVELERLERRYNLAVDAYKVLAKRHTDITMQVASRSQSIKLLDPAVLPARHFKPKLRQNVLISFISGLMVFLMLAITLELTRKPICLSRIPHEEHHV